MDKSYGAQYRKLYERHWWWRARQRFVLNVLEQQDFPRPGGRILDIGCGDGLFFDQLRRFGEPEGVEIDADLVGANGPWRNRIHIGPFDRTYQPERRFSLILMLDVLEHLPRPEEALAYALDLLEARGLLLITVPAFRSLWTTHDELNHHYTRYTKKTFRQLAEHAGAQLEQLRYFFHWAFAAKLAVRASECLRTARPSAPRVPTPAINRLLYWGTCCEQSVCSVVAPPFGSSLLATLRR